ncbi:integrin alpha-9-like isoform X2 [Mya arenaria]|uniref:integrin alpha-9-like isoform X2 n=1 Tax=Mya arenaria TaxID=6604 RepID=UPI0022E003B8|nr:integrin alpha-9-like isoform X2 [Mya arenaria]
MRFCSKQCLVFLCIFTKLLQVAGFNIDERNAHILSGDNGSYFGFSVAIIENDSVFIGAPKANDSKISSVYEPGTVNKCPVVHGKPANCDKFEIDYTLGGDKVTTNGVSKYFTHGKDGQWLGASLDLPSDPNSPAGIVTCAPRWHNTKNIDWYMNGICYIIPRDLTVKNIKKLPLLVNGSRATYDMDENNKQYDWGMAGLGFDAHYTKEMKHILFGAPGLKYWTGGFVDLDSLLDTANVMETKPSLTKETLSSLAGSAVTSGFYDGGQVEYYVIGVPRANLIGQVLVFEAEQNQYNFDVPALKIDPVEGEDMSVLPMNSYFGASFCTADVNGDGADDLFVGAPLHSPEGPDGRLIIDVGAVYLYMGPFNTVRPFYPNLTLIGRGASGGQFGTAIASLYDTSKDGYTDIAIGAPYEDDLHGAVYIYNGYKKGLWPTFSQRIAAIALPNGLSLFGFGASIARAADLNGDGIKDTIVGSYLSDKAVVLYGQPVISLEAKLSVLDASNEQNIQFLTKNTSNVKVKACFKYTYPMCYKIYVGVVFRLDTLKPERERVVFKRTGSSEAGANVTVLSDTEKCTITYTDEFLLLTKSPNDLVSEIKIEAEYEISKILCSSDISPTIKKFDGNNPGDPLLLLEQKVQFRKDCPNNICKTNLHLTTKAHYQRADGFLVIGTPDFSVDVYITKTGDPSYGSIFYLLVPNFLNYVRVNEQMGDGEVSCSLITKGSNVGPQSRYEWLGFLQRTNFTEENDTSSVLMCLFGNPMYNDSGVKVTVRYKLPSHITTDRFEVRTFATSLSEELNGIDNEEMLEIKMKHVYTTQLSGVSSLESIFISDLKLQDTVEHTFAFGNLGPSQVPDAAVSVHIPQVQRDGKALLWLNRTNVRCSSPCSVECQLQGSSVFPDVFMDVIGRQWIHNTRTELDPALPDINHLDCSTSTCTSLYCSAKNIRPENSMVVILKFSVSQLFGTLAKTRQTIPFLSRANTTDTGTSKPELEAKIITKVVPKQPLKQEVEWWVILLSILGGIIFIGILVFILYKCGFFKRKTREDMVRKLEKQQNTSKQYEPKDSFTDSEEGVIDNGETLPGKPKV